MLTGKVIRSNNITVSSSLAGLVKAGGSAFKRPVGTSTIILHHSNFTEFGGGGVLLAGSLSPFVVHNYVGSSGIVLGGSATESLVSPPTWLVIDTFTGEDGHALPGTPCDLAPNQMFVRFQQYGNSQIYQNKAYISPSGPALLFYLLGVPPTQIKWDYVGSANYMDLYFYQTYQQSDNAGYLIRINGTPQIYKRTGEFLDFTSGDVSGGLTNGTCTLDFVSDGFDLTIEDVGGTRQLTYRGTLSDSSNVWIGLGSNGGLFDNLYAK